MKRKVLTIIVVIIFLLVGVCTVSNAKTIGNNKSKTLNQDVYLGYANIYGDGIEENTVIEAEAENDLVVKIGTSPDYINFYIEYDIDTNNGLNDNGVITVFLQVNGEQKGHNETITFDDEQGMLYIKDVEVKKGDIFTFEMGVVYTNLVPPFTDTATAYGGGAIAKSKSTDMDTSGSLFWFKEMIISRFPLLGRVLI